MGVASGCGEQEAGVAGGSGWNLWVLLYTGCGCKEVYRFTHTTYPYSSCICSFYSSILLRMFFVLVPALFCNYILCLKNFSPQYKHTYGRPTAAI